MVVGLSNGPAGACDGGGNGGRHGGALVPREHEWRLVGSQCAGHRRGSSREPVEELELQVLPGRYDGTRQRMVPVGRARRLREVDEGVVLVRERPVESGVVSVEREVGRDLNEAARLTSGLVRVVRGRPTGHSALVQSQVIGRTQIEAEREATLVDIRGKAREPVRVHRGVEGRTVLELRDQCRALWKSKRVPLGVVQLGANHDLERCRELGRDDRGRIGLPQHVCRGECRVAVLADVHVVGRGRQSDERSHPEGIGRDRSRGVQSRRRQARRSQGHAGILQRITGARVGDPDGDRQMPLDDEVGRLAGAESPLEIFGTTRWRDVSRRRGLGTDGVVEEEQLDASVGRIVFAVDGRDDKRLAVIGEREALAAAVGNRLDPRRQRRPVERHVLGDQRAARLGAGVAVDGQAACFLKVSDPIPVDRFASAEQDLVEHREVLAGAPALR